MDKHKFFDWFIIILAIFTVILFFVEMFAPLTEEQIELIETIDFYIVLIFVIDLFVQFERYHHSWRLFWKHCWIDVVAILPLYSIFRFAKVGRLFKVAKAAKVAKVAKLSKLGKLEKILRIERLSKALELEKVGKLNKALHVEVAIKEMKHLKHMKAAPKFRRF